MKPFGKYLDSIHNFEINLHSCESMKSYCAIWKKSTSLWNLFANTLIPFIISQLITCESINKILEIWCILQFWIIQITFVIFAIVFWFYALQPCHSWKMVLKILFLWWYVLYVIMCSCVLSYILASAPVLSRKCVVPIDHFAFYAWKWWSVFSLLFPICNHIS